MLLACERGVCGLSFHTAGASRAASLAAMKEGLDNAEWVLDPGFTRPLAARIFDGSTRADSEARVDVLVRGTRFEIKVWEALLAVPPGAITTYAEVATQIGRPGAARAAPPSTLARPTSMANR